MKHLFILIIYVLHILLQPNEIQAQGNSSGWPQIGDKLPDISFDHMYNYPGGKAKLSDFRGKLVILDFWNMGCAPCIAGFPKVQKLQEQFNCQIQVLLVNPINKREELEKRGFPDKTKSLILSATKLPYVVECDLLEKLNPSISFPYYVWINQQGELVAKSYAAPTTESVGDFLKGKQVHFYSKPDLYEMGIAFDDSTTRYKSILQRQSKALDHIVYSSVITRNISTKGFPGDIYDSTTGKLAGYRTQGNIISLFKYALIDKFPFEFQDRTILDVDNPEDFIEPKSDNSQKKAEWDDKNIYCYELKLPSSLMNKISEVEAKQLLREKMLQDLEAFFGVKAKVEKRKVRCRILVRSSNVDKIEASGEEHFNERTPQGGIILKNYPFSAFVEKLLQSFKDTTTKPLIDETSFPPGKAIDINITAPLYEINAVRKELNKYDLDIVEGDRELEVLTITRKKRINY